MFVEFGNAIKKGSNSKYSMVSAFSNDYAGYVPTPECMVDGVYEARLATTSRLEGSAGEKIYKNLIEMSME